MTLSIIGTPTVAQATSITLPTHAIGDIIVIYAFRSGSTTLPTNPAASGTHPAWVNIDANTGANAVSSRTAYFVATATNHTSGTWTNASDMVAVVLRGQSVSPIGGHSESGSTGGTSCVAPSVTMTNTDGSSVLLHFFGGTLGSFGSAPAGYTKVASISTNGVNGVCLDTKNSTTSDGSVSQPATADTLNYRGATVEIVAPTAWTADSSVTVTATITGAATRNAGVDAVLALTDSPTVSGLRNALVDASRGITVSLTGENMVASFVDADIDVAVTAATSATEILAAVASTSETITATSTPVVSQGQSIDASQSITAASSSTFAWSAHADGSLASTATSTAVVSNAMVIDADLSGSAIRTGVLGSAYADSAIDAVETATLTGATSLGGLLDASLSATATLSAEMVLSGAASAATVVTATATETLASNQVASASVPITATLSADAALSAIDDGDSTVTVSPTGDALRNATIDAVLEITATSFVEEGGDKTIGSALDISVVSSPDAQLFISIDAEDPAIVFTAAIESARGPIGQSAVEIDASFDNELSRVAPIDAQLDVAVQSATDFQVSMDDDAVLDVLITATADIANNKFIDAELAVTADTSGDALRGRNIDVFLAAIIDTPTSQAQSFHLQGSFLPFFYAATRGIQEP